MKKLVSFILTCLCLITSLCFTACSESNSLDINVYFKPTVKTRVYTQSATTENLELAKLISDTPSQTKKYLQYEITADKSWIYGIYIESISFYIYSTQTREVEYDITITGTEQNSGQSTSSINSFKASQLPFKLIANKGVKITIPVNDTIILDTTDSVFTIALYDPYTEFSTANGENNFEYSIYRFEVVGYHK